MAKKKDIKVIVSFDNTKYTQEEAMLDKIKLLFLLNEIQINQDYRNKKISEQKFNYLRLYFNTRFEKKEQ